MRCFLLMLLLPLVAGVTWTEQSDAPPSRPDRLAFSCPCSAQSMLGADPLTHISGQLGIFPNPANPSPNPTVGDVDSFTFEAKADTLTLEMMSFNSVTGTTDGIPDGNEVTPSLFLFQVTGTVSNPIYTAILGARRFTQGTQPLPKLVLTPALGKYMIAVARNRVVPFESGTNLAMWSTGGQIANPGIPPTGGVLHTLGGWTAPVGDYHNTRQYEIDVSFTSASGGYVFGDPHFKGYKGQSFDFQGTPGLSYQLYSDVDVALNVQMIPWIGPVNKVAPNSTVMGHARFLFGSHFVEVSTASVNPNSGVLSLLTSEGPKTLALATTLEWDCATIEWRNSKLLVYYHGYELQISWSHRAYNNGTFLNVELDLPQVILKASVSEGGLLGQTLDEGSLVALDADLFVVSSLAATDSKTNRFPRNPVTRTC